jgi:hypothetical protein
MAKPTFTRMNLSNVRMIMAIMRVLVEELLCQAVMGQILVLNCPLSGTRGCMRLLFIVLGFKCHRFLRTQLQGHLPDTGGTPRCGCQGPGYVSNSGVRIRSTRLTGGKILPARGHRDGGKDWCGLLMGLVLFRLVVCPLRPGVVGPYSIQSTWFLSHLLLEGTEPYSEFLSCNRWPMVPRVQDPYSSPQAFCRVGVRSHSLDER